MDFCHVNNSVPEKSTNTKGYVVLHGYTVPDDTGSCVVYTEQGSSSSHMTAAKVLDVMSKLPGRGRKNKRSKSSSKSRIRLSCRVESSISIPKPWKTLWSLERSIYKHRIDFQMTVWTALVSAKASHSRIVRSMGVHEFGCMLYHWNVFVLWMRWKKNNKHKQKTILVHGGSAVVCLLSTVLIENTYTLDRQEAFVYKLSVVIIASQPLSIVPFVPYVPSVPPKIRRPSFPASDCVFNPSRCVVKRSAVLFFVSTRLADRRFARIHCCIAQHRISMCSSLPGPLRCRIRLIMCFRLRLHTVTFCTLQWYSVTLWRVAVSPAQSGLLRPTVPSKPF